MKRIWFMISVLFLIVSCAASRGASENNEKVLVAYFSASGNTERIARVIAADTGGDLFRIEPKNSYTSQDLNWREPSSRVNKEHEDESLRDIELVRNAPDEWDEYDVVFIGYPIWWQIAAWPVNSFAKANDFSDKTVIPFCTSLSSGVGNSAGLLSAMSAGGNWKNGHRFRENSSAGDVRAWLKEIGF